MKKHFAIFLLSIYLFSATDVKELLKINVVISHYGEHQKKDMSITFFRFLLMHYVTDDNNSKDNDRDRQLPFKSAGTLAANNSTVSVTSPIASVVFQSDASIDNNFLIVDDFFIITSYHAIVWHPPQFS